MKIMSNFLFDFFAEFIKGSIWKQMEETVENSPWHREANVATHTLMVVSYFNDHFAHKYTAKQQMIAMLALLFHDTGKPEAEEELEKADGSGKYRRYAGHELESAHVFMEQYLASSLKDHLTVEEARAIRWIIEHHLPYGYKNKQKLQDLKKATMSALHAADCPIGLFYDCLRADAHGRISDNHEEKLQNVETWIYSFDAVTFDTRATHQYSGKMYILVGPSGSGKSTFTQELSKNHDVSVINDDQMKMDLFRSIFANDARSDFDIYDDAWQYCTMDHKPEYTFYRNKQISDIASNTAKNGSVVVCDMVNSSKKRRAQMVDVAKCHDLDVEVVEFWVPLDTLLARQQSRSDKRVPVDSIKKQYSAIQLAWLGVECNSVKVIS